MARSTPFDTQRLTRFFGSGRAFYRSPMGGMIEHLRARLKNRSWQRDMRLDDAVDMEFLNELVTEATSVGRAFRWV